MHRMATYFIYLCIITSYFHFFLLQHTTFKFFLIIQCTLKKIYPIIAFHFQLFFFLKGHYTLQNLPNYRCEICFIFRWCCYNWADFEIKYYKGEGEVGCYNKQIIKVYCCFLHLT